MNFILTDLGVKVEPESSTDSKRWESSVYEVIRIASGIPLFLEDHFERLLNSIQVLNLYFSMSFPEFSRNIYELIRINHQPEGNVLFIFSSSSETPEWIFSFIPHKYPETGDYTNGVCTDLLFDERENPNAKVFQNSIREKANQMISERNLFEVILTSSNGNITEGSRSNIFFVKGNLFYTAPESLVLVGITRQKVIGCLLELGFQFVEHAVKVSELSSFDAVFLTGTSPRVLPVRSVGKLMFNTQLTQVQAVLKKYDELIDRYIEERK